ncbi:ankyrin repeat domain-containing protein [Micromonospora coxensis]|uniref:ankyrin repeat domain-containing protein n=1 Tax=Micromonospora coxensis TaxID=356852 RepID=UPI00342DB298
MGHTWDGITRGTSLSDWALTARNELADRARAYDWAGVLTVLAAPGAWGWVNATRPDGTSRWAPLHQAARAGAPVEVVQRLVELGAWRGLRTADGERPVDIAVRAGHAHLTEVLTPPRLLDVPDGELRAVQEHFHGLIRARVGALVDEHRLRLPELEVLLEMPPDDTWFAVPGMYGGFTYRLAVDEGRAKLTTESWMRVVGGSGRRHEITQEEVVLVAQGFV